MVSHVAARPDLAAAPSEPEPSRSTDATPWTWPTLLSTFTGMESTDSQGTVRRAATDSWARWWHWATFVLGVFGVVVQLWIVATQKLTADMVQLPVPIRLWNVLSCFTIWSNILVTVVAYLLARDPRRNGSVFAVFRLSSLVMITITGVIYALVLAQIWDPTGWQKIVDETLHYSVPILAVGGFLIFGPRPRFTRETLWRCAAIPVVWVAYTLIRSRSSRTPKTAKPDIGIRTTHQRRRHRLRPGADQHGGRLRVPARPRLALHLP